MVAEAQAFPKNAGPVQVLQPTGAGTIVSNPSNIKPSQVKFDHFPETCDACGNPIRHEDLIGKYGTSVFEVKGYSCPACRHKVGSVYYKNGRDSVVPFDWKKIHIPRCGKSESTRGEY